MRGLPVEGPHIFGQLHNDESYEKPHDRNTASHEAKLRQAAMSVALSVGLIVARPQKGKTKADVANMVIFGESMAFWAGAATSQT